MDDEGETIQALAVGLQEAHRRGPANLGEQVEVGVLSEGLGRVAAPCGEQGLDRGRGEPPQGILLVLAGHQGDHGGDPAAPQVVQVGLVRRLDHMVVRQDVSILTDNDPRAKVLLFEFLG